MTRLILLFSIFIIYSFDSIAGSHWIRLVPPASNDTQQGFIRITNPSSSLTATVSIYGVDDDGNASGVLTFELAPLNTRSFNSSDLENGNQTKGLSAGFGDGIGNWQVNVYSALSLNVLGFIRTTSGFMTAIHDNAASVSNIIHTISVFNPASNTNQVSRLRISNLNSQQSSFTITGIDDNGLTLTSGVTFNLNGYQSIELTSQDLEVGNSDVGLTGSLGDGVGKWRLQVTSTRPSNVMSLLEAPGGYLSNLSSVSEEPDGFNFLSCADIDGARIFSGEDSPVYLGFFGSDFASNSVNNQFGTYGSDFQSDSIRNSFGNYGSEFATYSHLNSFSLSYPIVVKNGKSLFNLTSNSFVLNSFSLAFIDESCSFFSSSASSAFAVPK
jgi:hypothetical protein